jgi:hypothetical protein
MKKYGHSFLFMLVAAILMAIAAIDAFTGMTGQPALGWAFGALCAWLIASIPDIP